MSLITRLRSLSSHSKSSSSSLASTSTPRVNDVSSLSPLSNFKHLKKNEYESKDLSDLSNFLLNSESNKNIRLFTCYPQLKAADALAMALLFLFYKENRTNEIVKTIISSDLLEAETRNTLFRNNSICTKMVTGFTKLFYPELLKTLLKPGIEWILNTLLDETISFEVNPIKIPENQDLERNTELVIKGVRVFLDHLLSCKDKFPNTLCSVYKEIYAKTDYRFSDDTGWLAVGSFLFLRYYCPAIVSPDIIDLSVTDRVRKRGLILIAKVIQTLANGATFGSKEKFMTPLNVIIEEYSTPVREMVDALSSPSRVLPRETEPTYSGIIPSHKESLILIASVIKDNLDLMIQDAVEQNMKVKIPRILKSEEQVTKRLTASGANTHQIYLKEHLLDDISHRDKNIPTSASRTSIASITKDLNDSNSSLDSADSISLYDKHSISPILTNLNTIISNLS